MRAVLEAELATSGQEQGKVFRRMSAPFAVAHAGAVKHHRMIEHIFAGVVGALELSQEAGERAQIVAVYFPDLRKHSRISSMMRQLMMVFQILTPAARFARPLERNYSRGIRLQRKT